MPLTEGYPHPEYIETPQWLAQHLNDPNVRVVDARGAKEYAEGHIPGAINAPSPLFKAADGMETCSAEEFAQVAGQMGIRPTDIVIAYEPAGAGAGRVWWAFERFGHPAVRYLPGGLKAWQAAGHPVSTEPSTRPPVRYELQQTHDDMACTLPQAISSLDQKDVLFWDTRSEGEYTGAEGRNNPRVGHIPKAVHLEWSDLTDPATGMFKPETEMRRILEAKGITPEMEVVTY